MVRHHGLRHKRFKLTPVAPTNFQNEPFREHIERLTYCGYESCIFESAVQTDDFEDLTFRAAISAKPFLGTPLRKFKRFYGKLFELDSAAMTTIQFQFQSADAIL